jgi:hypothetical protein
LRFDPAKDRAQFAVQGGVNFAAVRARAQRSLLNPRPAMIAPVFVDWCIERLIAGYLDAVAASMAKGGARRTGEEG